MPAAAVIPAPIAYIKVVAVKKFVVNPFLLGCFGIYDVSSTSGRERASNTVRILYVGVPCILL